MKFRTIICVDGPVPDVERAKRFGLTYVHLPVGYDSIPRDTVLQLAKAVAELPGPVYIHCHHGKHRGPAAAAVACISAGLMSQEQGLKFLAVAGTSPQYEGLYRSVRDTKMVSASVLRSVRTEFQSAQTPPPIIDHMGALQRILAKLQKGQASNREDDDNGLNVHQAKLLHEHFRELQRLPSAEDRPIAFQRLMLKSAKDSARLHKVLNGTSAQRSELAETALARVKKNCAVCHGQFR